jgi:MscS family membrane protein
MKLLFSIRRHSPAIVVCLLACVLMGEEAGAQLTKQLGKKAIAEKPPAESVQDSLGRNTPRGAVLGFLTAAYAHNYETGAQYLNTRLRGQEAAALAQELFYVLDRRLPAKLNNLSNEPQGSMSDPLDSRRELVGTVASANGNVDIYLERVDRGETPIWMFSRPTLAHIPDLYEEINAIAVENILPDYLLKRYFGFSLFGWIFFCVFLPLLYVVLSLANKLSGMAVGWATRIKKSDAKNPTLLPHPFRLLLVAGAIHWTYSTFSLSLVARQIGSVTTTVIAVIAFVWIVVLLNGRWEAYVKRRMERRGRIASTAILRPARRLMDITVAVTGLMFALHSFGINPTAALAGLGVGGIAIALAAQKTLENVIGGASIILDEAVRVGDFFKVGDVIGTVEEIGLRSTRVRTLDRTLVTIPNGQMATVTLENFSARDSFWLRHVIGVRYETATSSIGLVIENIGKLLRQDRQVVPQSERVRFLRFAKSSLDIEVFAYVSARDWSHFLEIQQDLLLQIRGLIESAGLQVAFPSRIVYIKREAEREVIRSESLRQAAGIGKT